MKNLKALWKCPTRLNDTRFMCALLYRRIKRIEMMVKHIENSGLSKDS